MQTTLLTLFLTLPLTTPAQDAQAPQEVPRFRPPVTRPAEPLGKDGKPLVPGELPADTSPQARAAWRKVCAATRAPDVELLKGLHDPERTRPLPPIQAFDLSFDVIAKSGAVGENTTKVRFRFLGDPGYLRYTLESGREHLRGPDGDWLLAGDEATQLVGERFAGEDKQQIEQGVAIARNFVALTDPSTLRIASLAIVPEPPIAVPAKLRARASKLAWLDVKSPDFQLVARRDAPAERQTAALFRVLLGHDERGLVAFAIVQRDAGPPAPLDTGALFVDLGTYEALDGFLVPRQLVVYDVDETARPPAFREREIMDLYRIRGVGGLRPQLGPDDFRPGR